MDEKINSLELKTNKLQGKATIEIFEGDKLIHRISKKNYINAAFRNYLARLVADGKITQQNFSLNSDNSESYFCAPYGLSLVNNDLPPAPSRNEIPLGDVVGYAERGQTSPDSRRGVYIAAESVTTFPNYRKLVFDFPTSSANGTFNNIYTFQGYQSSSTDLRLRTFHSSTVYGNANSEYIQMYALDDIYYYALLKTDRSNRTNTQKLMRFTKENFAKMMYNADTSTDLYDVITLNFPVRTLTYLEGYFYFTGDGGKLYRAAKSNPGALTLVRTYTSSEIHNTNNFTVDADKANKKLYLFSAQNPTPAAGTLFVISTTDFSILDRMSTGLDLSGDIYPLQFDPTGRFMGIGVYVFDTKLKRIVDTSIGRYLTNDGPFGMPISYGGYLTSYAVGTFSRFILDSPVTKTSTQTMKITYEFTLDTGAISVNPIL